MTIQEKIKEGLILITKDRKMAYQILKFLDSKGAKLPKMGIFPKGTYERLIEK